MKKCILYKKEKEKNNIRCLACAHKCLISEGESGICGVRKNINRKLILLVYEKIIALHIDPIEKKPIYNFLPESKTFSIGTIGCNLSCDFCQNFDISQSSKGGEILGHKISAKEIVEQALGSRCKSIAYTYNEPIIWIEFVKEIAELANEKGLKNVMVTNGYWSKESFEFIKDYIDAVNIDLKGDNEFYKKYCGAKVGAVRDTIQRCSEAGIHIEVTTLVIPGRNDSLEVLEDIAKFLGSIDKEIVWHLSRFFPMYNVLDKEATPILVLEKAREIGGKYLNKVVIGNV